MALDLAHRLLAYRFNMSYVPVPVGLEAPGEEASGTQVCGKDGQRNSSDRPGMN